MTILAYALLGAFMNCFIRGGFYKQFVNWPIPSKLPNALLFGLAAYYPTHNWQYGVAMAVAMLIGQAPALFDKATDSHVASREYLKWACVVWLRGLIWCAPIVAVACYFNGLHGLYFGLAGFLMPLCYSGVFYPWGNRWLNEWTFAEITFGALLWGALVV